MRATMMDTPLTITALMRYGTTAYGDQEVITATSQGAGEAGRGMRRRTYSEIGSRVARLASGLRSLGVTGDQRVATLMWNNAEHLEAYLAIPSMGAVLHTLNLRLDPTVIGYIAEHAGDEVVIVDSTLVPLLATVLPHAPSIRHIVISDPESETRSVRPGPELARDGRQVHSYEELLAGQPDGFDWPELDERSAAAMCYTSGTTGHPKGVVYSHRSMHLHSMAVAMGNVFGLSDRDKVLPVVPMFHANAWGLPYAAVMAGAELLMPDRFLQPAPLAAMIEAERPTLAGAVPTIWNGLLQHVRANGGDLSSLRLVPCGGSAVPHALIEAYEKELGVTIVQAWGMTETSPLGSVARPPGGLPDDEAWHYRDTQGRLMCQVEGRLVGDEGTVLPNDGVAVGEVEVRGPWVTGSYYKDDDPGKFRQRLAAHRRRWHHRPPRLRHPDRPGQGRDQVWRRVDLVHGAGERADGPPERQRGSRHRRARRQMGRAAAGRRRAGRGLRGQRRRAARLPGRAGAPLAAARALVVHRRGAQDQRRQVRQDHHARGLRPRRLPDHRGSLSLAGPGGAGEPPVCFADPAAVPVP